MTVESVQVVRSCQICRGDVEEVIDFLPQPPVQAFLRAEQLAEPEMHFPLQLQRCPSCGNLQLGTIVDPEIVFPKDYPYQTGMTRILVESFDRLAADAVETYGLGPDDLAVDVGSNDGTLLKGFERRGVRVLGVEPTDIARIANENGIETVQEFFSAAVGATLAEEHGPAAVVSATNVLAHVPDPHDFVAGVRALLRPGGVFVSDSHYLLELVTKLQYDTIYHEHLRFYGLRPLTRLLEDGGFTVVDAERVPTHGGSVRVWALNGAGNASSRLRDLVQEEEAAQLYERETLDDFTARIVASKHALLSTLLELKSGGARIVGVGAPARSSMLLNYAHVDPDLLDYVTEPTGSLKIGLYTPASHIPIVDEQRMLDEQPEYALMLSWHIANELAPKLASLGYRGRCVVPLPEVRIL